MRLVGQMAGSYLLLHLPRRFLLVGSALSVAAGMAALGAAAHLNVGHENEGLKGALGVLPLIGITIVALAYQVGLGPIPWSYTSNHEFRLQFLWPFLKLHFINHTFLVYFPPYLYSMIYVRTTLNHELQGGKYSYASLCLES